MGTFPMALHPLLQSKVRSSQAPCTIRRCSSAYRPSLLSVYMRTPGMNRCTVALSLLLQSLVEGSMPVLSHHLCKLLRHGRRAACAHPCTCYTSPAADKSNVDRRSLFALHHISVCCHPRSLNILKSLAPSQCRRRGGTDRCPVQSRGLALLPAISDILGLPGDGNPRWHPHLGAAAAAQEVANTGCQHYRGRLADPGLLGTSCGSAYWHPARLLQWPPRPEIAAPKPHRHAASCYGCRESGTFHCSVM